MCTSLLLAGLLTGVKIIQPATEDVVNSQKQVLKVGENGNGSVSYMAHGGTNFGYWSGANGAGSGGKQHTDR